MIKPKRNLTLIARYFFEKLSQSSNYEEVISNRHRTCNGYILIAEIQEVCETSIKRRKNSKRIDALLEEASSTLGSSVISDYIIKKYFPEIHAFYKNQTYKYYGTDQNRINRLYHAAQIQLAVLDQYYNYVIEEIKSIDQNTSHFNTETDKVDQLINCFLPYIIYKGYSLLKITDEVKKTFSSIRTNYLTYFVNKFNFINHTHEYYIYLEDDNLADAFIDSLIHFTNDEFEIADADVIEYKKLRNNTVKLLLPEANEEGFFVHFKLPHIDEYSAIRMLYQEGLRHHIISKERRSLEYYLNYFDSIVISQKSKKKFLKPRFNHDPIDVNQRPSTLRTAIEFCNVTKRDGNIPYVKEISESLYYYNLALGSKSIENSLLLLWTSLESLIPFNVFDADITNTKYFLSKILSTPVNGRHLYSFVRQLYLYDSKMKKKLFPSLGIRNILKNPISEASFAFWFDWITASYDKKNDPFYKLEQLSPLVSKSFCYLNKKWNQDDGKLSTFVESIDRSKLAIEQQLDRIYLARNRVVHAGNLIKEYTNIWAHLEWYVGKLLGEYLILDSMESDLTKEKFFFLLESKADNVYNLLKSNNSSIKAFKEAHGFTSLYNPLSFTF